MSDQYYKDTKEALGKFEYVFDNAAPHLSNELQDLWGDLVNEVNDLLDEYTNKLGLIDELEEDLMQLKLKLDEV